MRNLIVGLVVATALTALGCEKKTAVQPTPVCGFTINSTDRTFSSDGGTAAVSVTASAESCGWAATPDASWVTITGGATGTGSGVVQYSIAANTSPNARTATLVAAGRAHAISQQAQPAANCTYALAPERDSMSATGGDSRFNIVASAGCAWSATSHDAWLAVTGSASGTGDSVITYRGDPNTATGERTGTIVVGGRTFVLVQAGQGVTPTQCDVLLAPTDFDVCLSRGTVVTEISAAATCGWTASTNASWLTFETPSGGVGSTQMTVAHGFNYDAPRVGVVTIRGSGSATQSFRVNQGGCKYTVSQSSFDVVAAGASDSFNVVQNATPMACGGPLDNRCEWTPATNVSWISIANNTVRVGDDPVDFTVAPNTTPNSRSGTITVRDTVVTITQAGQ